MSWNHRAMVLAAVLLVSVTGPVLATTPTAQFGSQTFESAAGDTVEIPITLSDADAATVKIGSDRVNYVAAVVVRDGNDDQNVTLQYNTSKAGHTGGFSSADDEDTVSVESETEFKDGQLIDPGAYSLAVEPGTEGVDNATDAATLRITESADPTTTAPETTTAALSPYAGHVAKIQDGVVVAPAKNQTITGSLDVEPGTEIRVRISSPKLNLLQSTSTTATDDGRFRASFDFGGIPRDVEDGTEFQIIVRADGEQQKKLTGTFRTPPTQETTTTTQQAMQDETTQNTTQSQDGTTPGFGLATGVLALTAVALLALRSDA